VDVGDGSVLIVLGAFDGPFALESNPAEERPVLGFIVGRVDRAIPIHCVDELADALIGLLGLAVDCHLVLTRITFDGGMSISGKPRSKGPQSHYLTTRRYQPRQFQ
jgi:hypothetical protein